MAHEPAHAHHLLEFRVPRPLSPVVGASSFTLLLLVMNMIDDFQAFAFGGRPCLDCAVPGLLLLLLGERLEDVRDPPRVLRLVPLPIFLKSLGLAA